MRIGIDEPWLIFIFQKKTGIIAIVKNPKQQFKGNKRHEWNANGNHFENYRTSSGLIHRFK
jgi:hypothetical protein